MQAANALVLNILAEKLEACVDLVQEASAEATAGKLNVAGLTLTPVETQLRESITLLSAFSILRAADLSREDDA